MLGINWFEVALVSFLGLLYYELRAEYGKKHIKRHKPTIY